MSPTKLTLAIADYDRVAGLIDGSVPVEGVHLDASPLAPSETFFRMLKDDEFDVSEMSLSSFLIAREQGRDWTAIPVFPYRTAFHVSIYVREDGGVESPADLVGKRFGLTEYQVTAALWTRGVLQHDFGLDLREVEWCIERSKSLSHGGETGFTPPPGIKVTDLDGATLSDLLVAGDLDAVLPSPYPGMASRLNRTDAGDLASMPGVRRLFLDPAAEVDRYYRSHGFLHMNHTVVVQGRHVREDPSLPVRLYDAFVTAQQDAYDRLDRMRRSSLVHGGLTLERQRAVYGDDPFPYGFTANKEPLQALVQYSAEQGLIISAPAVTDLFHESTLDT
jgi:4,5-dihydroxyphthalate decarboxylase